MAARNSDIWSGPAPTRDPFFVGRPRPRSAPRPAAAPTRVRLTARGGILAIVVMSLVAALATHLTGQPLVNGIAFPAACVLAAALVRPGDLLALAVSPPLAYFAGALLAESALTLGSDGFARGVAIGMGTRLADIAPSLFLGTALVLVITLVRGLPRDIRDLNDELNGRKARAQQRRERQN